MIHCSFICSIFHSTCGGLTMAGCQMPTQQHSRSLSSTVQWEENKMKRLIGQDKDREMVYRLLAWAKQAQGKLFVAN